MWVYLIFQEVSVSVSVMTMTYIAYDRYNAICNPLKHMNSSSRSAQLGQSFTIVSQSELASLLSIGQYGLVKM